MKLLSTALLFAAVIGQASAHYRFLKLIANGATGAEYASIRTNTNANSPVTDVTSEDLRCNVGALASASSTTTTSVTAGSTIGFEADIAVFHPGVFNIYMAKAPSTAAAFDGSGSVWFKVWEEGPASITTSAITFDTTSTQFKFTVPKTLPDGEYLVRIEHIALHSASTFGGAQFYISCAQIKVTGGGSGSPSPKVAIPGVYTGNEPGILLSIWWPIPTTYTQPGPAVWSG
ncbi:family 61 glycoside hydrolase [Tricharina praecox]|uniref:family 61 glycoside hydrolase n=1 Tax=Tricharina praecox TaxID=43433 RepID=UPI0022210204|nr:family 61 glycoside hydrolase [Tricharina praecox]KAI5843725.1 family 61 glycoside hydrolase [Tricharina praecox]